MQEKYRIMRTMATVYKVLAWVVLVTGVIVSIMALVASSLVSQQLGTGVPAGGGFFAFVFFLAYTLIAFGSLYAVAEGIHLLFDIYNETKMTREQARQMRPAA